MIKKKSLTHNNNQVLSIQVERDSDLNLMMEALNLDLPAPVVVLVGGANGLSDNHLSLVEYACQFIAQAVNEAKAILVDGGTQSGVMEAIGTVRSIQGYNFPLIGVAVENLVVDPNNPEGGKQHPNGAERTNLDPNHSHFILVPGNEWGDESSWISRIAEICSAPLQSVTILMNGGDISRQDVNHSLKDYRPVISLLGTGRLADELAKNSKSDLITTISAEDGDTIYHTVSKSLRGG